MIESSGTTYTSLVEEFRSNTGKCQVLLFGYNRPDLLKDRLDELILVKPENLYVSIDWHSPGQMMIFEEMLMSYQQKWPTDLNFEYRLHKSNQGLAVHLTETITKALISVKAVIVIEDDVSISKDFIKYASSHLLKEDFHHEFSSIGGYSIIRLPKRFERINRFRRSVYFQCWGWGTRKEIWDGYIADLRGVDFEKNLSKSKSWNSLSRKQKSTWLGRFEKIQRNSQHTWDTQFQYLTFILDKPQLLPIGRLSENLGFGDKRSEHTKNKRPWWLGKPEHNEMQINAKLDSKLIDQLLQKFESLSLIGDSQGAVPLIRHLVKLIKAPKHVARLFSQLK